MLLVVSGLLLSSAQAFPPAPDGLIFGMVKDQYGTPLMNTADTVILQTPGGIQVAASIQPNLAIGVNYAVYVPMDAGVIPTPYVANALVAGTQYKLLASVGNTTNLPIEMAGAYLSLGKPSAQIRQDLTLGTDANGDGIPDEWERMFLSEIGTNLALSALNPNGIYTRDGRTLEQEYLLGNFPFDPTNGFSVNIISQNSGSALLAFSTMTGRTYKAYGSADLQNWTPVSFIIPASGSTVMSSYYASGIQPVQIQTVQPTNGPVLQFFRLQLQ
jgi:hypothetical protein